MILDPLGANDDDEDDDDEPPAKLEDITSHQTSTTTEGPYTISSIGNNVHSSKLSQLLYPTDTKDKQSSAQKVRCVVILTVQCHISSCICDRICEKGSYTRIRFSKFDEA